MIDTRESSNRVGCKAYFWWKWKINGVEYFVLLCNERSYDAEAGASRPRRRRSAAVGGRWWAQKCRYQLKAGRARRAVGCHPSRGGGRLTRTNEVRFDPTPTRPPLIPHSFTTYAVAKKNKDPELIRTAKKSYVLFRLRSGRTTDRSNLTFKTSDNCSIQNIFNNRARVSLKAISSDLNVINSLFLILCLWSRDTCLFLCQSFHAVTRLAKVVNSS